MCNEVVLYCVIHHAFKDNIFFHTGEKPTVNLIFSAHSGEKPHKCVVCDKVLANSDSLFVNYYVYKNNIYCHTEEKPDECDICDEAFVNSMIITNDKNTKMCDLNGNYNSHNEEKSPKCTVYYKVFNNFRYFCWTKSQLYRKSTGLSYVSNHQKPLAVELLTSNNTLCVLGALGYASGN